MNLALSALKRAVPVLNERPLTAEDFYQLCRRARATVVEMPLKVPGFMMVVRGRAYIHINSRLCGLAWLEAAFHEYGHFCLHTPPEATVAYFFRLKPDSKEEHEADVFASLALLPEPKLRRMLKVPAEEWEPGFTKEMVEFRLTVLETYCV